MKHTQPKLQIEHENKVANHIVCEEGFWSGIGIETPQLSQMLVSDIKGRRSGVEAFNESLSGGDELSAIVGLCNDFARQDLLRVNGYLLSGFCSSFKQSDVYKESLSNVLGMDLQHFKEQSIAFKNDFLDRLNGGKSPDQITSMLFYLCEKKRKEAGKNKIDNEIVDLVCKEVEKMCKQTHVTDGKLGKTTLEKYKEEVVFIFVCASMLGISPEKFLNFAKRYNQSLQDPMTYFSRLDDAECHLVLKANSILNISVNEQKNIELSTYCKTPLESFMHVEWVGLHANQDGGEFISKCVMELPFEGDKVKPDHFSAKLMVNNSLKGALKCEYSNAKFLMEHGKTEGIRLAGKCIIAKYRLKRYCEEAFGAKFPMLQNLNGIFDFIGNGTNRLARIRDDGMNKVKELCFCDNAKAAEIFNLLVENKFDDAVAAIANISHVNKAEARKIEKINNMISQLCQCGRMSGPIADKWIACYAQYNRYNIVGEKSSKAEAEHYLLGKYLANNFSEQSLESITVAYNQLIEAKATFIRKNIDKNFIGKDLDSVNKALFGCGPQIETFFNGLFGFINRKIFCSSNAFSDMEKKPCFAPLRSQKGS